ncbi:cytochrome P450 [Anopheles sinensis]|uniref:Cytochrome P450 n=1 Tax=Anopheles sinensis TaxID=74873 RepID=A0A084WQK8_ANOSI|nr:cytochrome P450 [Anopheles sinensis]
MALRSLSTNETSHSAPPHAGGGHWVTLPAPIGGPRCNTPDCPINTLRAVPGRRLEGAIVTPYRKFVEKPRHLTVVPHWKAPDAGAGVDRSKVGLPASPIRCQLGSQWRHPLNLELPC